MNIPSTEGLYGRAVVVALKETIIKIKGKKFQTDKK